MEQNNINEQQPSPIIEKVSIKDIDIEKTKVSLEEDSPVNNFVKAAMALNDEELDLAITFLKNKLRKLQDKIKDIKE